ncbi:sensor histidine kinase [Paenibacillus sp. CAU 1782]
MFNKLRNRFLLLNLITISVIMLVAFASIYTITYRNAQNDIKMDLHRIADAYQRPQMGGPRTDGVRMPDAPAGDAGDVNEAGPIMGQDGGTANSEEASGGVGSAADGAESNGSEGRVPMGGEGIPDSRFGGKTGSGGFGFGGEYGGMLPERTVSFTLKTDTNGTLTEGTSQFDMDEELFAQALAKVSPGGKKTSGQISLDGSHWAYTIQQTSEGYMIVFLDVSARQDILTNLIYTFAIVGIVMLIVIFFTSRYFANRSISPVKEAFDKQKQFIADASHELKTPLTIIHTNADVLLSNGQDTINRQAKWLHYIKSETERMTRLTNDLLYLTEMDDARARMFTSKFNMSEAVETILLTMEAVFFEKNVDFHYEIDPELKVNGNSEQIKQVIMILLDNAVKYTQAGGKVELSLKKQHQESVLAITNTGEGIAAEHLTRIFDRFYRTDTSRARKQGGYGLGLAIAKSIIDQHKGRIYAKSTPGESTTFYVHLALEE